MIGEVKSAGTPNWHSTSEGKMKRSVRNIGRALVTVGIVGFFFETQDTAPIQYQFFVWLGAFVLSLVGYFIYRQAGGCFHWKELFQG